MMNKNIMKGNWQKWKQHLKESALYLVLFTLILVALSLLEEIPPFKNIIASLYNSRFLGILESLSILAAVILFFKEAPARRKREQYEAWRVINSAYGQRTSGGRIQALQDLNDDHVSLAGLTADKAFLAKINLQQADLRYANLQAANLRYASLQEIDLRNANLQETDLMHANLQAANLTHANLQSANLKNAHLQGASLASSNFDSAYLWNADLSGVDLSYANLQDADLSYANLTNANLSYANCKGADLSPANLQKANLQGANLRNADLRNVSNLNPEQVKLAKNWEYAKYDDNFQSKLGLSTLLASETEEARYIELDTELPDSETDTGPTDLLFYPSEPSNFE